MCGDKLSINSCLQYLKYYIKKNKKNSKKNNKTTKPKHNTTQHKTCNHRFLSLYTFKSFEIVLSGRNYCVVLHNIFLNEMRSFVSVKLSMQLICFLFTSASTFL